MEHPRPVNLTAKKPLPTSSTLPLMFRGAARKPALEDLNTVYKETSPSHHSQIRHPAIVRNTRALKAESWGLQYAREAQIVRNRVETAEARQIQWEEARKRLEGKEKIDEEDKENREWEPVEDAHSAKTPTNVASDDDELGSLGSGGYSECPRSPLSPQVSPVAKRQGLDMRHVPLSMYMPPIALRYERETDKIRESVDFNLDPFGAAETGAAAKESEKEDDTGTFAAHKDSMDLTKVKKLERDDEMCEETDEETCEVPETVKPAGTADQSAREAAKDRCSSPEKTSLGGPLATPRKSPFKRLSKISLLSPLKRPLTSPLKSRLEISLTSPLKSELGSPPTSPPASPLARRPKGLTRDLSSDLKQQKELPPLPTPTKVPPNMNKPLPPTPQASSPVSGHVVWGTDDGGMFDDAKARREPDGKRGSDDQDLQRTLRALASSLQKLEGTNEARRSWGAPFSKAFDDSDDGVQMEDGNTREKNEGEVDMRPVSDDRGGMAEDRIKHLETTTSNIVTVSSQINIPDMPRLRSELHGLNAAAGEVAVVDEELVQNACSEAAINVEAKQPSRALVTDFL